MNKRQTLNDRNFVISADEINIFLPAKIKKKFMSWHASPFYEGRTWRFSNSKARRGGWTPQNKDSGGFDFIGGVNFFAGGALLFQIIEIHTFLKQIMIFVDKYYFLCLMINTYNIQYHMIFC